MSGSQFRMFARIFTPETSLEAVGNGGMKRIKLSGVQERCWT